MPAHLGQEHFLHFLEFDGMFRVTGKVHLPGLWLGSADGLYCGGVMFLHEFVRVILEVE